MIFAFDEQFAMFDITPVENQFILEYLPGAKGEYIKVYLYGLFCCYHPQKAMNLENMCRELEMNEEEVLAAFRYWERRGIVRRIQDRPPEWKYINIKQKSLEGGDMPIDDEYAQFCRELQDSFDGERDFRGTELRACFEWKESMFLPNEVIIMLLKHMQRTRGKRFKISDAEKLAVRLSEENALTPEEAADVLGRDEAATIGFRKILRKLGKHYSPSDANLLLYKKWTEEWHFTQEAIEDACDQTGTSDPSLALVDTILENAWKEHEQSDLIHKEDVEASSRDRQDLRQVLREIGQRGGVTPAQRKLYMQMREMYPQSIILLAAQECGKKQKKFDSVLKLLQSWKERGFEDEDQIQAHIQAFHEKEEFLQGLKGKWSGQDAEIGQAALKLLDKWEKEYGFSREMISLAADNAFEVRKPLTYMDKTLSYWKEKQIRTPDAVRQDRRDHQERYQSFVSGSGGKSVPAQNYGQREYDDVQDEARRRLISMMGGGEDA